MFVNSEIKTPIKIPLANKLYEIARKYLQFPLN